MRIADSSTWFHREHYILQLSGGPAATTKVVSQSREAPAITKFNLKFSEIEASRNFLNRIPVFDVVPHPPRPRVQKLERLLDLQVAFQPFDRFPILDSAKALKFFNRLRQQHVPAVVPFSYQLTVKAVTKSTEQVRFQVRNVMQVSKPTHRPQDGT